MPDPQVITLRKPVGPKGQEITELRLREPTVGEYLKVVGETKTSQVLALLKLVSGANPAAIDALPERVIRVADKYIAGCVNDFTEKLEEDVKHFVGLDEMPDEFVIDLPETLQIGTTWVTQLKLRELTGIEMVKSEKVDGIRGLIYRVAFASDQPRAVIEFVPLVTFAKAAAYVLGFFPAALTIGGESSDA